MSRLRRNEQHVLDAIDDAGAAFDALPAGHSADAGDFAHALRACQNIVLARVGSRAQSKHHKPDKPPVGFV